MHLITQSYIHRSQDGFSTGLKLHLPQKFIFIPFDVFRKITYTVDRNIDCELVAWLLFLTSDKPEELVGMYSEALEIMDRNTVRYIMEGDKKEIERHRQLLSQKD